MYVRNCSKKRKYLIVKLFGTSSSDWSLYLCGCRYSGCIRRWDVLIRICANSTNKHELGRKNGGKSMDLRGKTVELTAENWRDDRSTPKTTDLWTKTTKNATNPEIQIRAIFLGKFFWGNFWPKLVESEGQIRGNLCSDTI